MTKEPRMGRADILLAFLEKLGMNDPSKLDPYIDKVDLSQDQPVSEQVVDMLLREGNRESEYEAAKTEVGVDNPYSSASESTERSRELLGRFLVEWNRLDSQVDALLQVKHHGIHNHLIPNITDLVRYNIFSPGAALSYDILRRQRNRIVHTANYIDDTDLETSIEEIERLNRQIDQTGQTVEKPRARRTKKPSN